MNSIPNRDEVTEYLGFSILHNFLTKTTMNMKSLHIQDWLQKKTIINVSGTMTALRFSVLPEEIKQCVDKSFESFVNMYALQAEGSSWS